MLHVIKIKSSLGAGNLNKIQTLCSLYGSINAVAKHSVARFREFLIQNEHGRIKKPQMAGGNHWAIYKQLKEDLNFGRAINNPAPVADWPPTQKFLWGLSRVSGAEERVMNP